MALDETFKDRCRIYSNEKYTHFFIEVKTKQDAIQLRDKIIKALDFFEKHALQNLGADNNPTV